MPQQQTSSPGQGQRFDWWAAPAATTSSGAAVGEPPDAPPGVRSDLPSEPAAPHGRTAVPAQPSPARTASTVAEQPAPAEPAAVAAAVPEATDSTEVYRAVQAGAAFQDIRRSYRSFVFPVTGAFLGWYLMYVAAQAAAPDLMRTRVAGPLNVAWLLGLLQFASTFLLTWLYARNARTKRDRAALGLRWDTQDQLR
ncbi:DUF485 domain-containing protein [Kitasatospora sp. NPDC059577]|uniref:DUF485 domain-containing protein n=1 Tax=Kitasatospora sp. NPDC059577 TaxID=3346873 RepID=UPI0036B40B6C